MKHAQTSNVTSPRSAGSGRFWMEAMYTDLMWSTASLERRRHLRSQPIFSRRDAFALLRRRFGKR